MSEIKIAIIGCGSIANIAHLPSISKTKGLVLEAVCSLDTDDLSDENVAKFLTTIKLGNELAEEDNE